MSTVTTGLDRRHFLALLGAGAALPCLGPLARTAAAADAPAEPLRLGYLLGSEALVGDAALLRRLNDPREPIADAVRAALPPDIPLSIVDADTLPYEPFAYPAGRATVMVHGLLPPLDPRVLADVSEAALEVDFHPGDGGAPYPFHAWRLGHGLGARPSAPCRFTVSVDGGAVIGLRLATTAGPRQERTTKDLTDPPQPTAAPVTGAERHVATTLDEPGLLRPGLFLLPLSAAAARALPVPATYDWLVPDNLPFLAFSVIPEPAEE